MAEADPHKSFDVDVAQTDLPTLVDRAHAGEEIVLAKAGVPWAKIVPIDATPAPFRRWPGGLTITGPIPDSVWSNPLPEEDLAYIDDRPEAERC